MKADNYFMCCEKCFEHLCRINPDLAKVWMDACATFLDYNLETALMTQRKGMKEEVSTWYSKSNLGKLERLGYLLSTEVDDAVLIRIVGHYINDDNEHYFCVKEGKHDT